MTEPSHTVQVSKDHHYVPKAILKNFCFSGKTTYYLRKDSALEAVEERNIDSIFKRRHFNSLTLPDGMRNDSVEKFFAQKLDNFIPAWVRVLEESIEAGTINFCLPSDRNRFIQFFFNHMKRSPDFIEPIVNNASEKTFYPGFIDDLSKNVRPLSKKEVERFSKQEIQRLIIDNSRVVNLSNQSETVLNRLASMKIFVATPSKANKQFIVGSNPVVRFEEYLRQPLGEEGVELWTTLTPRIAVGFAKSNVHADVLSLGDAHVRKINAALAKQSSAIASNNAPLLQSIARACW